MNRFEIESEIEIEIELNGGRMLGLSLAMVSKRGQEKRTYLQHSEAKRIGLRPFDLDLDLDLDLEFVNKGSRFHY